MVIGGAGRVLVLRLGQGEDVEVSIKEALRAASFSSALISGIGAFSRARIGWFDPSTRAYAFEDVEGPVEVASLSGNYVRDKEGKEFLHLHAVLGTSSACKSGHLLSGTIGANLEVFALEVAGVEISRARDDAAGIDVLDV